MCRCQGCRSSRHQRSRRPPQAPCRWPAGPRRGMRGGRLNDVPIVLPRRARAHTSSQARVPKALARLCRAPWRDASRGYPWGRSRLAHLRATKSTRNAIDAFKNDINTIGVKYSRCNRRRKEATCLLRCSIRSEPVPRPARSSRSNVGDRYP
jgi:hypothetical protein